MQKASPTGAAGRVLQARLQLFKGPCVGDVMSSGKADTIRCHPLCLFIYLFLLDSSQTALKRKAKQKKKTKNRGAGNGAFAVW